MKLKDKKITQCSYIESNGTKYDLGYGKNLSPEITLNILKIKYQYKNSQFC